MQRDDRMCSAPFDVNSNNSHYEALKPSHYCSSSFIARLVRNDIEGAKTILPLDAIANMHRVFIPIKLSDDKDDWVGIIIDIFLNHIYYYDPKFDNTNSELLDRAIKIMDENVLLVNNFLSLIDIAVFKTDWAYQMLECDYFPRDINENDFDSAIYLYTVFDMCDHDMPLIFNQNNINVIRSNLCYNVMNGRLS
jgi:hypothetical protein